MKHFSWGEHLRITKRLKVSFYFILYFVDVKFKIIIYKFFYENKRIHMDNENKKL